MRDLSSKTDGASQLSGAEFNQLNSELENAATRGGETLDAPGGPDTFLFMLARSMTRTAQASSVFQDTGSANNYVLGGVGSFEQPTAYHNGMMIFFVLANTNTGASVVNVESIGNVNLTKPGGTAFASGELVATNIIGAVYRQAQNRFEVFINTTPPAVGAAAPNNFAVYEDTGSATGFTLGIEAGFTQPSSFTDAMVVLFRVNVANDGNGTHPATFSGLGSKNVVEKDGTNPAANRMRAGDWVQMVFRETRDAFEIAFVYSLPQPDTVIPAIAAASSGTTYNLTSPSQIGKAPAAYFDGLTLIFPAPVRNTGAVNVGLDSIGLRNMRNFLDQAFVADAIPAGSIVTARYVASINRFLAHIGKPFTDLTKVRSAKSLGVTSGAVSNVSSEVLDWAAPGVDPLSFFNPGNDNFAIPAGQGIKKVDVTFFGDLNILNGESWSASIVAGGITEASGSVRRTTGTSTNSSITLHAQDVAVTDGTNFNVSVGLDAAAPRTFTRATFAIRATEFGPL